MNINEIIHKLEAARARGLLEYDAHIQSGVLFFNSETREKDQRAVVQLTLKTGYWKWRITIIEQANDQGAAKLDSVLDEIEKERTERK